MTHLRRKLAAVGSAALLSASFAPVVPVVAAAAITHRPRVAISTVRNAGWTSSNWSGYAITGSFTSITGEWNVPRVSATSGATYSSDWIGIDGFNNSSLIQTGTEADYYSGAAHYGVWWEILPAAATFISVPAAAGDHFKASITKGSGSTWTISITNVTKGKTFTTSKSYSGPGSSAEWILEAPTVGGRQASLAHYSSPDTFDPGTANGRNPGLTTSNSGAMVQRNRQVSTPSRPDGDTDGFNMSYGSTAPSPPSS